MMLEELNVIEEHTAELNQELATLLRPHQEAVERLAEVPGLGVDSAQQMLAEVGATAATFASDKNLCSWVGVCPGDEESAGKSSEAHAIGTKVEERRKDLRSVLCSAICTCDGSSWGGRDSGTRSVGKRISLTMPMIWSSAVELERSKL
jgi:transposase